MKGDKAMNYTYTVRYVNKEFEQVVMEFNTRAEAVAKAEYLTIQLITMLRFARNCLVNVSK